MPRNHTPPLVAFRKEDPPPPAGGIYRPTLADSLTDELAKVKADPGEWYAMLDYGERVKSAASGACALRKRAPAGFEFVARNGVVYSRYVGTT